MSSFGPTMKVTGLQELESSFAAAAHDAGPALLDAIDDSVRGLVARARPLIPSLSGRARASLHADRGPRGATLTAGGPRVLYFGWLDYGGRVGRQRSVSRPFLPDGRYIWPTFTRHYDDLVDSAADSVFRVLERDGLEVHRA